MKRRILVLAGILFLILLSCSTDYNNYLKSLEIQSSQLIPSFNKEIEEYNVTSLNSLRAVKIIAIAEDSRAKVEINYKLDAKSEVKIPTLSVDKFIEIKVTAPNGKRRVYKIRTLPKDCPKVMVKEKHSPSEGYIFLTNFSLNPKFQSPFARYSLIVDNNGNPVYYRKEQLGAADFKMLQNGSYSFFSGKTIKLPEIFGYFTLLDENFNVSSTFTVENAFTDMHDFKVMGNGNYLMFGVDIVEKDLSVYGGLPNAKIWDYIIQESDPKGKKVKVWRSLEHFSPADIISDYDIKLPYIEHGANCNSIWVEKDGGILLSSRKLDEISKINWKTGEIIWRMGGIKCKNNQFKFIDDPLNGFSHQHSISRTADGNLLMLDNGNYNSPNSNSNPFFVPKTRVVEYQIDEAKKTAKLVWQYQKQGIFIPIMGSVQRLENGNTLICWGKDSPCITEVDAQGRTVLEMDLPEGFQCFSAYKFEIK